MNRKDFLGKLAVGVAAAAVGKYIPAIQQTPIQIGGYIVPADFSHVVYKAFRYSSNIVVSNELLLNSENNITAQAIRNIAQHQLKEIL